MKQTSVIFDFIQLVNSINQYYEQNGKRGAEAREMIVKSGCTSSLPLALQKISKDCEVRSYNLYDAANITLPRKLLLRERVWGLKLENQLIFDLEDYALDSVLKKALRFPMAKVYSDRQIEYYMNGDRVMRVADPIGLVDFREQPLLSDLQPIDAKQLEVVYPGLLGDLMKEYSEIKPQNWRFMTDNKVSCIIMAMDEYCDVYLPFADYLNRQRVYKAEVKGNISKLSNVDNLQQTFKWYAENLRKGNYSVLAQDDKLHTCLFTQYVDNDSYYKVQKTRLSFLCGYIDLTYEQALEVVSEPSDLRRAVMAGMKRFCVTVDGQVVDAAKVVGSSHYSSGNERIILVPEFVYEKWGREFSEAVVGLLSRKRKFSYKSYSNDFMYNLSGRTLKQFEMLKQIGSLGLKAVCTAAVCSVAVSGVVVTGYCGVRTAQFIGSGAKAVYGTVTTTGGAVGSLVTTAAKATVGLVKSGGIGKTARRLAFTTGKCAGGLAASGLPKLGGAGKIMGVGVCRGLEELAIGAISSFGTTFGRIAALAVPVCGKMVRKGVLQDIKNVAASCGRDKSENIVKVIYDRPRSWGHAVSD
jgi:hypothetical protein